MIDNRRAELEKRLAAALSYNDRNERAARVALKAIDDRVSRSVLAARLRASGTCTAREADRIAAALDGVQR